MGQERPRILKGAVKSLRNDVSNLLIVNLNSKKSTITDSLGLFSIEVKLKDTLQISAVQNVINLNEVTVTPYNLTGKIDLDIERLGIKPVVTSSSLGLPNANIEVMTQSERLLLEADRGKYVYYYGIALVINTHKIMNKLSGRTKSFEDMIARDENMELEKEIISKFSKKTLSESFDIPEANIDGISGKNTSSAAVIGSSWYSSGSSSRA